MFISIPFCCVWIGFDTRYYRTNTISSTNTLIHKQIHELNSKIIYSLFFFSLFSLSIWKTMLSLIFVRFFLSSSYLLTWFYSTKQTFTVLLFFSVITSFFMSRILDLLQKIYIYIYIFYYLILIWMLECTIYVHTTYAWPIQFLFFLFFVVMYLPVPESVSRQITHTHTHTGTGLNGAVYYSIECSPV